MRVVSGQPLRLGWMIAALLLADLTSTLEISMLYSAMPTIVRETGNIVGAGWLITAFLLVQGGAAAIGSRLGDLFGRRKILVGALLCCAVGSAISAFSGGLWWIIAGRAIQGTSGCILPLCYGLIRENVPEERSQLWVSVMSGTYALGGAFGYISGAAFAQYAHWQQLFYLTLFLPLAGIGAIQLFVPPSSRARSAGNIDLLGGVLFVPSIMGVLIGVSEGGHWGWTSSLTLGVIVGSLLCFGLWIVYETRHANPLIDVRLLTHRQVALANGIYAMAGLGAVQMVLVILMLLQQPIATGVGFGLTAVTAALLKLPGNLCSGVGGPIAGIIGRRNSSRLAAIAGAAIQVLAWIIIIALYDSKVSVLIGMMLSSLSSGMLLGAIPNVILEVAPAERTSEATGVASVTRAIATAAGTQIVTLMLASSTAGPPGHPYPSVPAYLLAFWFIAVVSFAGLVLAWALPSKAPRPVAAPY